MAIKNRSLNRSKTTAFRIRLPAGGGLWGFKDGWEWSSNRSNVGQISRKKTTIQPIDAETTTTMRYTTTRPLRPAWYSERQRRDCTWYEESKFAYVRLQQRTRKSHHRRRNTRASQRSTSWNLVLLVSFMSSAALLSSFTRGSFLA